ncbi:carboxypeptidase regulatory-like domain-containing protein [Planctomicrobium sp. SH664]|uniref:carboxypeptidase regulatory-like domain-containing protein n=1 Tax=Planctomicrobium sp. SH664 TaxID=3448125 RepID=UPI003F5BD865
MSRSRLLMALSCLPVLCLNVGCWKKGPDLGVVKGTVTMDGKPLPRAGVAFFPKAGGRPAFSRTNNEGKYELKYHGNTKGALLGDHEVRITTFIAANLTTDENDKVHVTPEQKEVVPKRYNDDTELSVTVEPSRNEYNFDLVSN